MPLLTRTCRVSGKSFVINEEDQAFYAKMGVPLPTLCPEERQRRRLSFRNERYLYHRKCDLCGKPMISIYDTNSPYTVYCSSCWWSDQCDPFMYGRDFDFTRSFFDQFNDLMKNVPRPAILNRNSENSEYTNLCENNKNCFLLVESSTNEDSAFSYWLQKSKNCFDCSYCSECEFCYECDHCQNCYNLYFSQNSQNCSDSWFLKDCIGCRNCFGCVNLRQKEFFIFNQQYSPEDYFKKLESFKLSRYSSLMLSKENCSDWQKNQMVKFAEIHSSEDCSGDAIFESKNCYLSYEASEAWDCRYSFNVWRNSKDNVDVDTCGMHSELNYECINTAINSSKNIGCSRCWGVHDSYYSNECDYADHLFGCIGLRRKRYCVLNRQYTQEEYQDLLPKIVEYMKKTGEWGEFFPIEISPFAYNETPANDYYPLLKEEVLLKGYSWRDEDEKNQYQGPDIEIPDRIEGVADEITKQILKCEVSGKLYKIIPQELEFYRKMKLPIPRRCPDQRHRDRLSKRNPRQLWERTCDACGQLIQTTYAPDRPEKVYCDSCYLKAIY